MSWLKKIWNRIKEPISDAFIFFGMDVAVKKIFSGLADKAAGKVGDHVERVLKDDRAMLLEDLRVMETEDPASVANLRRRHKESYAKLEENRFVALLCKIPYDPQNGRRPTLKYLNGLDDEAFWQWLYLLEHDVVLQYIARVRQNLGRLIAVDWKRIKALATSSINAAAQMTRRWRNGFPDAWRRFWNGLRECTNIGSSSAHLRKDSLETSSPVPYYDLYGIDPPASEVVMLKPALPSGSEEKPSRFWKWAKRIGIAALIVILLMLLIPSALLLWIFGLIIKASALFVDACIQMIPFAGHPVAQLLLDSSLCSLGAALLLWLFFPKWSWLVRIRKFATVLGVITGIFVIVFAVVLFFKSIVPQWPSSARLPSPPQIQQPAQAPPIILPPTAPLPATPVIIPPSAMAPPTPTTPPETPSTPVATSPSETLVSVGANAVSQGGSGNLIVQLRPGVLGSDTDQLSYEGQVYWNGSGDTTVKFGALSVGTDTGETLYASAGKFGNCDCFYGGYRGVPCWQTVHGRKGPIKFRFTIDKYREKGNAIECYIPFSTYGGGPETSGTLALPMLVRDQPLHQIPTVGSPPHSTQDPIQ